MGTQIKGGNNQVGTSNTQFIESTVITNSHVTLNINVNCTECLQHQHQEGISFYQGNELHVIDGNQKLPLTCGQPIQQIAAESETQPQCGQAIPAKSKVVKKRRVKLPGLDQQTQTLPESTPAIPDSVRILDPRGQVLKPGDAVCIDCKIFSLYVGGGCVVWYQERSRTVVKEKFDLTRPITKLKPKNYGTMDLYSPELRVQRALQQVGRECPVTGGHYLNFVCWTFTGLSYQQTLHRTQPQQKTRLLILDTPKQTSKQYPTQRSSACPILNMAKTDRPLLYADYLEQVTEQHTRQLILNSPEKHLHTRPCPEIIYKVGSFT